MTRIVSGAIAVILLGLYGYAISRIWRSPKDPPSEPISTILNLVGGLVSAAVIAVLAITPNVTNPAEALLRAGSPMAQTIVTYVVNAYVLGWLCCGVALLIRWVQVPDASPALSGAAKSWLGLAIAAAYAFLGLKS
jgi:hypothetical protein